MLEKTNDTQTAIDAGSSLSEPMQALNGTPYTVLPAGYEVHSLEELLPQPTRIRQSVTLHDEASFVAYIKAFQEPTTAIFFNQLKGSFRAVLDYHGGITMGEQNPSWCGHSAHYSPKVTPEWAEWLRTNNQRCNQAEFATFLEKHLADIKEGQALLKVALNMQVHREARFTSSKRLDSVGTELLTYQEDVQGTATEGKIAIPPTFTLLICPYLGSELYSIECRFGFQLKDGRLSLWYEIKHPERVAENALRAIRESIEEGTGLTAFAGE